MLCRKSLARGRRAQRVAAYAVMRHLTPRGVSRYIGAACQAKGLAWVQAMRAHSGNSVCFKYMHLSSALLAELILRHGMLERNDDEILERETTALPRSSRVGCSIGGGVAIQSRALCLDSSFASADATSAPPRRAICTSHTRPQVAPPERLKLRPHVSSTQAELVKLKKEQIEDAREAILQHLTVLHAPTA
eukprot:2205167-Pleurochrysis_carterae.AAC.1